MDIKKIPSMRLIKYILLTVLDAHAAAKDLYKVNNK